MSIALNGDGIISGVSSITVGAGASVFSPAANTLAFGTNDSERVRIDSSGNIGIGTNSPADGSRFHIQGGGGLLVRRSAGTSIARFGNTGSVSPNITLFGSSTVNEPYIGCSTDDLIFGTSNTERARVDSSGRLLLGTTSSLRSAGLLQIAGSSYPALDVNSFGTSSNPEIVLRQARGSQSSPTVVASGDSSGKIFFQGYDGVDYRLAATIECYMDATPGANDMPGRLVFATTADGASSPTERLRIDNAGRVQIGTTSLISSEQLAVTKGSGTALTLNVYNSAATSTSKNANPIVRLATQGSGADCCLQVTDSQSHNYYFGGNNGGAYVVTNSNGVRLSNGGTSWASDSDERVKDIIEPITDGLDKVSTLRAVIGKYKTDDEGKRRSFLIAQDVQAVLPESVYDEQGTLMLAYTDTIPLLVAALKESKERIEQLEAKVAALESV